jgi:hypothetical protein
MASKNFYSIKPMMGLLPYKESNYILERRFRQQRAFVLSPSTACLVLSRLLDRNAIPGSEGLSV